VQAEHDRTLVELAEMRARVAQMREILEPRPTREASGSEAPTELTGGQDLVSP
jgi:hypothetical protein